MKKVLLTSTALILSAGIASADVTVGGDGRMGIIDRDDAAGLSFTSRIRISFAASGETDGGLTFGGSIRADNAPGGVAGTAGSVFISGAFGKLTMGDTNGAAEAAVGDVSGVGLTGLADLNETNYLLNTAPFRPNARYEYSFGDVTVYASAENPAFDNEGFGLGVKYSPGTYSVALGYESVNIPGGGTIDHIVLGATGTFAGATVKFVYGDLDGAADDQIGLSVDYAFGATKVTGFAKQQFDGETDFGIGAAYDLGGGASLKGGVVRDNFVGGGDRTMFDFGIAMTF